MGTRLTILERNFDNRNDLIAYVKELAPWAEGNASQIPGGQRECKKRLTNLNAVKYGKTRNHGNGSVSMLSPYINHGVITLNEVRNHVVKDANDTKLIESFVRELGWRDFWSRFAENNQNLLWNDVEDYKTGYASDDYQEELPEDILAGDTGVACIDSFIADLLSTGYVHNHARMYLASYIVHFRQIKWQAGARWFLSHLLDGDVASNNFSWQWVASTFSNKPYIFNLENVDKYFSGIVDTTRSKNRVLDASYPTLHNRLFPNLEVQNG